MICHTSHGYVGREGHVVIPVTMEYDETDPLAVTVTFHREPEEPAVWTFGRELLAFGLTGSVGEGPLRIGPQEGHHLTLFQIVGPNSSGTAVVRGQVAVPREDVRRFLAATGEVVPFGSEDRLVAAALEDFLASFQ